MIRLVVPVVLAVLVCVGAQHELDGVGKACSQVTTHEGIEDLDHGWFACQAGTGGKVFLQCSHGTAYATTCPADLLWNMKKSDCDYASAMDCRNPPYPQDCDAAATSMGVKNLIHGQWACADAAGENFRRCWDGVMYDWVCPVGTHMNTKLGKCQWQPNADCSV